jgi:D-amino peptidase
MKFGRDASRVCVVLAARAMLILVLTTSIGAQAGKPLKVFISVDMEGITGVVQPEQLGPDGFEYERFRDIMTKEVLAAIDGAKSAGATEFIVCDSHGNAQNVLIDQLPDDVRIVRGFPRPLEMMQGVDQSFGAVVFVGYHGSEYAVDAVRGHTISSAKLLGVRLNGMEVTEGILNAGIAGQFGVPVVFVSGDRKAVEQLKAVAPWVEGAIVKEGLGYHSAITVTPARGREMIRDGVAKAIRNLANAKPYKVATPVQLDLGFKLTIDAERAAYVPGLTRTDAHNVRGTFPDLIQISQLIQVLTSLEKP